jgi:hypothetical protein
MEKIDMGKHDASVSKSGMAIAGLVLGIIALVSSWMPILNNISALIALVGAVLAIVGVVGTVRGKHSGKALAIAAVVINVVAFIVVLVMQSATKAALDKAIDGPSVSSTSTSAPADSTSSTTTSDDSADAEQQATTDLAVGASIDLENGLSVSVDSVDASLTNYDGSTVVGVNVTYTNNGSDSASYNEYDWKGEDANGAQEYATFYSGSAGDKDGALNSGTLSAGGSKSGTLYFEDGTVKILYFGSIMSNDATASWDVA